MKVTKKLAAIFDHTLNVMSFLAGLLIVFATLSIGVAIASRYFLGRPIGWVVEVSAYILLYVTFLVAPWVLRDEGHITIDIAIDQLNSKAKCLINFITSAIGAMVFLVLTWYGAKVTWNMFQVGYFTDTMLELPKFIIIGIIFLGSFMFFIQLLRRAFNFLWRYRMSIDEEQEIKFSHEL